MSYWNKRMQVDMGWPRTAPIAFQPHVGMQQQELGATEAAATPEGGGAVGDDSRAARLRAALRWRPGDRFCFRHAKSFGQGFEVPWFRGAGLARGALPGPGALFRGFDRSGLGWSKFLGVTIWMLAGTKEK
jgi:hypothetical protein